MKKKKYNTNMNPQQKHEVQANFQRAWRLFQVDAHFTNHPKLLPKSYKYRFRRKGP